MTRPDWVKFTQGLRDAGLAAFKAAQSKSQDAMVDASGTVASLSSRAGVFVSIDSDGSLYVERGYVRPEDEPAPAIA